MCRVPQKVRLCQQDFMFIPLYIHRAPVSRAGIRMLVSNNGQAPSQIQTNNCQGCGPRPQSLKPTGIEKGGKKGQHKAQTVAAQTGSLVLLQCVYTYACAILLTERPKINPSYSRDCLSLSGLWRQSNHSEWKLPQSSSERTTEQGEKELGSSHPVFL